MLEKFFPTFRRWVSSNRSLGLETVPFAGWFRGPTWYVSTWFGDTLATQQRSLLRMLSVAHRERLEMGPLIHCLADEHRGRYRWRLRRLARLLESGTPLVEALEQTPDALDDDTVLALRFGSQTGALASTFEMLLPDHELNSVSKKAERRFFSYWMVLGVTIGIMLIFLMAIIAPTYVRMFDEFGLQLPVSFRVLQTICDLLANYAVLWILCFVLVLGIVFSSAARRFFRRQIAPMVVFPLAQQRTAELLRLLALGIESGRPVNGALSTLARYHFDGRVRQRLLYARNEIEQGVEAWQCLADAHLISPQQSLAISTAPSNEIRAWTLRRLAATSKEIAERRTTIGLALLQPLVLLVFGAIVFFVFVSFFSVLIAMILSLA